MLWNYLAGYSTVWLVEPTLEGTPDQVPFANIGLPLQPRFRTVRTIKRSEDLGGINNGGLMGV